MSKFFRSKLFITIIIITVITGILMAVSTIGANNTNPVSNAVGTVTTPVSNFFGYIGGSVSGFFENIWRAGEYKANYDTAQERIKELEKTTREIDSLKHENERLKGLLGIKDEADNTVKMAARVISVSPSNWYEDVLINKGEADGVKIGSTVISNEGLVGHVTEVGVNWAKVMTVLDVDSSVGCYVARSDDVAIIEGDITLSDNGECSMNYISKDATLAVGDSVETSDVSSIYPAGILIGKISRVQPDSQGFYNKATVKTAVDFRKLREVIVIVGGEN